MIHSEDGYLIRIITTNCFVTCVYIPATIILLVYSNNLYNIGKYGSYYLLLGLTVAEYLKYSVRHFAADRNAKRKYGNRKNARYKEAVKNACTVVGMTFVYYVVAVLFGAQVFDEQEQTLMFSALLSVLTVVPACINLSVETTLGIFSDLASYRGDLMSELILRNVQFTLVGAWLGAFVIPLDWDRQWQQWPIPCSLGALVGYFFAHGFVLCTIVSKNLKILRKETGKYGL